MIETVIVSQEMANELDTIHRKCADKYRGAYTNEVKFETMKGILSGNIALKVTPRDTALKAIAFGYKVPTKEEQFLEKMDEIRNALDLATDKYKGSNKPEDTNMIEHLNSKIKGMNEAVRHFKNIYGIE